MVEGLIGLLITLGILVVVYLIVKWVMGQFDLPGPALQIINIIFGIIGIILVLRFLTAFLV